MTQRKLSFVDQLIDHADQVLRTLSGNANQAQRSSPAASEPEAKLTAGEHRHVAGLMRVNHSGEVCAQALYQGQALTARLARVRKKMEQAAAEEVDHLVWCEERLQQLDSYTSHLNPIWYGLSFALGAAAGVAGDRWSLGFVAATEESVCEHLTDHLQQIPQADQRSRKILKQILEDEQRHGDLALQAGGENLPAPVKRAMAAVSKVMTNSSYRI